jgi:hypothetical protein
MVDRVGRALLTAGLAAAACGLLYGLWSVGPSGTDCGSAFIQKARDSVACVAAVEGRTNTAWLLMISGGSVAAGAVVLTREPASAKQAAAPGASDPA